MVSIGITALRGEEASLATEETLRNLLGDEEVLEQLTPHKHANKSPVEAQVRATQLLAAVVRVVVEQQQRLEALEQQINGALEELKSLRATKPQGPTSSSKSAKAKKA